MQRCGSLTGFNSFWTTTEESDISALIQTQYWLVDQFIVGPNMRFVDKQKYLESCQNYPLTSRTSSYFHFKTLYKCVLHRHVRPITARQPQIPGGPHTHTHTHYTYVTTTTANLNFLSYNNIHDSKA